MNENELAAIVIVALFATICFIVWSKVKLDKDWK